MGRNSFHRNDGSLRGNFFSLTHQEKTQTHMVQSRLSQTSEGAECVALSPGVLRRIKAVVLDAHVDEEEVVDGTTDVPSLGLNSSDDVCLANKLRKGGVSFSHLVLDWNKSSPKEEPVSTGLTANKNTSMSNHKNAALKVAQMRTNTPIAFDESSCDAATQSSSGSSVEDNSDWVAASGTSDSKYTQTPSLRVSELPRRNVASRVLKSSILKLHSLASNLVATKSPPVRLPHDSASQAGKWRFKNPI